MSASQSVFVRLANGLPEPEKDGNIRVRTAPWFLGLCRDLLREQRIDMNLEPRADGTYDVCLRRYSGGMSR